MASATRQRNPGPEPPPDLREWHALLAAGGLCRETFTRFRGVIYHYYLAHRRDFSWREEISPYRVLVSELMLQQTQTTRVVQKFAEFISVFPAISDLAEAPFSEVLKVWKGLGYNRRARYLQETAQLVMDHYGGALPDDPEVLVGFPGIGPATAASICTFAFNTPQVFIETNIRTVYLHFFFAGKSKVHDREIMPLVEQSLDRRRPRDWYYALMDYGVMLKKRGLDSGRRSSHYQKQSPFEGSDRQVRGRILQLLLDRTAIAQHELPGILGEPQARIDRLVADLVSEDLIRLTGGLLTLS